MFMKPAKPQLPVDMAVLRDNVFTFAGADFTPWLLQLNQINVALFLQQQLPDMSVDEASLKGVWSQPGSKQELPQHGLPLCPKGYYSEAQNTGDSLSLTTGEDRSMTDHRTPRPSMPSYVSPCPPSTGPSAVPLSSNANALAASEPLDPSYWHLVSLGSATLPPFVHGGDPMWDHANQGGNPSLLDYGNHMLGVHASVLPQTVFRPGEVLHNPPPTMERESSTSSRLYASDDMLGPMALDDEPDRSLWSFTSDTQTEYGGPRRCVEMPESDSTNSTWDEPAPIDGETVSPKMLRIQQTPSPSSSCDSIHTCFLADAANQPLPSIEPLPSQATKPTGSSKKSRRLLPNRGQRALIPPSDTYQRQSTARSDPPSPPPRKLTRLRPKARPAPTPTQSQSQSSPPAMSLETSQTQFALSPAYPVRSPRADNEALDLSDRMSKDEFLVRQKQLGMTYREIRRMGGFVEAESTLRGRYRTLTKSREARVRRPEWSEKDLHLLTLAVTTLSNTSHPDLNPSKVPWKKVAEYIVAHGGSYHFGNSTCRKRWDELVREGGHRDRGYRGEGPGLDVDLDLHGGRGMFECEGLES